MDCIERCDSYTGCVALSWVGLGEGTGDCWLKSTVEGGVSNNGVDGAYVDM